MFLLRYVGISLLVTVHYSYGMQKFEQAWLAAQKLADQCIRSKNECIQEVEGKKIALENSIQKIKDKRDLYYLHYNNEVQCLEAMNELLSAVNECKELNLVPDSVKKSYEAEIKNCKELINIWKKFCESEKKLTEHYDDYYEREKNLIKN